MKSYDGFMQSIKEFIQQIGLKWVRAVQKWKEMDEERAKKIPEKGIEANGAVDIADNPLEQRLGPGGLDPLEVFPMRTQHPTAKYVTIRVLFSWKVVLWHSQATRS